MLRAVRELLVVLAVILGLAFLAAYLYQHVGNVDAHKAYSVVFYVGGAGLLVFAILTRGAEGWAYDVFADLGFRHRHRVAVRDRALNPTGTLALAAVLLLVLGGVFDTVLR